MVTIKRKIYFSYRLNYFYPKLGDITVKSMSNIAILLILTALSMTLSGAAFASGSTSGQITYYTLNSAVIGRDTCVRMVPTVPTPSGWACLYNNNPLRTQISTFMREVYEQGKRCSLFWNSTSSEGHAIITNIECGSTQ